MIQHRSEHRPRARRALALLACLLPVPGVALATGPDLAGTWVGSDLPQGLPSSVRMTVDAGPAPAARLAFGVGRRCTVTLGADAGPAGQAGRTTFVARESNGGRYCDALVPGTLTVEAQGEDAIAVGFAVAGGASPRWQLRRRSAVVAEPADADSVAGDWQGRTQPRQDAAPIAVALTLGASAPGDRDNGLRYGGTRACTLTLAYEGALHAAHYYSVLPAVVAGGWCERLADGYVQVWRRGDDLLYRSLPDDGDCPQGCAVSRAADGS